MIEREEETMKLYSVATGTIDPSNPKSVEAVEFVKSLPGMAGVYPGSDRGMLWMFNTFDQARSAMKQMSEVGIITGKNICKFRMRDDGAAEFISVCMKLD